MLKLRLGLLSVLVVSCHLGSAADLMRPVKLGEINFLIPAECELTQVADESLIKWPIVVDFDRNGDLLVVESGGVAKPIEEHNKKGLHRIVRLLDTNHDGKFDRRVVVADQLPFTEGVLSIGNDLLACAPPNIYRLIDADGDGVCEKREVWFDGQTITGCANDLHGPYLGRDGWIYWCKGAFAEQKHQLINGDTLKSSAAHIFRRKLEGGPIEPVMTGGMDNPVEVAITPEGERFFTSTFLVNPGNGMRDGIAHAIYGGVYGKPYKVIEGHPRTGPLMPIMTHLGAAAPSGLICLESNQLVKPNEPNERTLVAALFNLQKVTVQRLKPNGASFTSKSQDLVVADRIDFHPTDILEEPDGSLLVIDTGGWYDLCCPSSRVDQMTAPGGIYRLSRKSTSGSPQNVASATTNLDSVDSVQLVGMLHDNRPWVARAAQLHLSKLQGDKLNKVVQELAAEVINTKLELTQRLDSLWAFCSLGASGQRELVKALSSAESSIAHAACQAVSLLRCKEAKQPLEKLMNHESLAVRRAAAEGLGRIGDASSVKALMSGLNIHEPDRALEHSVTYAIFELKAADAVAQFASIDQGPRQQQAAMIALGLLNATDRLSVDFMLSAVSSTDPLVSSSAAELLGRNPEWANKYADALRQRFADAFKAGDLPDTLLTIARGWKDTPAVKEIAGTWIEKADTLEPSQQQGALSFVKLYSGTPLDAKWASSIAQWLVKANPEIRSQLVGALSQLDISGTSVIQDQLVKLAKQTTVDSERLQLLAAMPNGTSSGDTALEQSVLNALQSDDASNSQSALQALKRMKLTSAGGTQLLSNLKNQQPRSLAVAIEAINRLGDDKLDQAMLASLTELPAAKTLSMDQLRNLYRNRNKELQGLAGQTIETLSKSSGDVESKVDATLAKLLPGDPIRGLTLFRSQKTACSGCHRIAYVGGEIGPELTRIGGSRTRRALLEAIMFPSARLEQSYQPTKVLTKDGQVYNGLIKKYLDATHFEMQLTVDKAVIVDTADIEQQEPSSISIMPAGVVELLTIQELSDLMAFLESAK